MPPRRGRASEKPRHPQLQQAFGDEDALRPLLGIKPPADGRRKREMPTPHVVVHAKPELAERLFVVGETHARARGPENIEIHDV